MNFHQIDEFLINSSWSLILIIIQSGLQPQFNFGWAWPFSASACYKYCWLYFEDPENGQAMSGSSWISHISCSCNYQSGFSYIFGYVFFGYVFYHNFLFCHLKHSYLVFERKNGSLIFLMWRVPRGDTSYVFAPHGVFPECGPLRW